MFSLFRRFVGQLAVLIGFVVTVPLAIANRQVVALSLDPFGVPPSLVYEAPLYVWLMLPLMLGVVLGASVMWFDGHRTRVMLKLARRDASKAEAEAQTLRAQLLVAKSAPTLSSAASSPLKVIDA